MKTIEQVLIEAIQILKKSKIKNKIMQARLLLAFTINKPKEYLIINYKEIISKEIEKQYFNYINQLSKGKPLQYIIKNQEFMKLNFYINESVLIPREDTEVIVYEVCEICGENKYVILDLCTGSGIIAISLNKKLPQTTIYASDISKEALKVAEKNNLNNNTSVQFINSDFLENINNIKFNIIVSNPPYIETSVLKTLSKQVLQEPVIALDGGEDGLDAYKKIIQEAYRYLEVEGYLCLEIGYNQNIKIIELIEKSEKYKNIYSKKDLSGNDRIIVCQKR